MATEVWFRNPHDYIRELVECGEYRVAWDRGLLVKKRIDPIGHAELYFGTATPYRVLTVGTQGSAEYRPGDALDKPTAVYPTWSYGEDSIILEDMIANPLGEDTEACNDKSVRPDERPVFGQEHRVIVTETPPSHTGSGRAFLRYLKELQEEYPKCIIHFHGTYSWKTAFGLGFGAADVEPRAAAQKGRVHMPSGRIMLYERVVANPQWAAALGFKPNDLAVPRNRCMFNIKSAVWAGSNFLELYKFRTNSNGPADHTSSDEDFVPSETKSHMSSPKKVQEGDKMLCDVCSLQNNCKYFRDGAVCTVPGAEPVRLARMFNTRNADDIIDGLSLIASAGANRLERSMEVEQSLGDVDPEVSKLMGQVFDQGVKLAKLVDPARFSTGAKVSVQVGPGGTASVQDANPRQLVASVIQELVRQGHPRDQITQEMIQGAFEGMVNPEQKNKAITGTVESVRDEAGS